MDRMTAIEKAKHFRINHEIIDAYTGDIIFRAETPAVKFYSVSKFDEKKNKEVFSYHRKVLKEIVPSISKARRYVRENKLKVVAARDATDKIKMRLLIDSRVAAAAKEEAV